MILVKQYVAKDTSHEPSQNTFADRKMLSKLIFPGKAHKFDAELEAVFE